jgi:hypothetical protein
VPFTGSHPAAILPFLSTPLPASALVIGSMTPDLPYYLPLPFPWRTHSAPALFTADLVLGVLVWALWHGLLAEPALRASPSALRARLTRVPLGLRRRLVPRAIGLTAAAVVLGAATHVLWDEFTHPRRWGTAHIPALAETWGLLPGYRWLQYASGLVGGAVLLVWFAGWWRRTRPEPVADPREPWWVWALLIVVGGVTGGIAALSAPSIGAASFAGATSGGGAVLVVVVVLGAGWHASRRLTRAIGPDTPRIDSARPD